MIKALREYRLPIASALLLLACGDAAAPAPDAATPAPDAATPAPESTQLARDRIWFSASPDGAFVAYEADLGDGEDLYIRARDGDAVLNVSERLGWVRTASFAPDSRWLTFITDGQGTSIRYELQVADLSEWPPRVEHLGSVDGFLSGPSWSADGERMLVGRKLIDPSHPLDAIELPSVDEGTYRTWLSEDGQHAVMLLGQPFNWENASKRLFVATIADGTWRELNCPEGTADDVVLAGADRLIVRCGTGLQAVYAQHAWDGGDWLPLGTHSRARRCGTHLLLVDRAQGRSLDFPDEETAGAAVQLFELSLDSASLADPPRLVSNTAQDAGEMAGPAFSADCSALFFARGTRAYRVRFGDNGDPGAPEPVELGFQADDLLTPSPDGERLMLPTQGGFQVADWSSEPTTQALELKLDERVGLEWVGANDLVFYGTREGDAQRSLALITIERDRTRQRTLVSRDVGVPFSPYNETRSSSFFVTPDRSAVLLSANKGKGEAPMLFDLARERLETLLP